MNSQKQPEEAGRAEVPESDLFPNSPVPEDLPTPLKQPERISAGDRLATIERQAYLRQRGVDPTKPMQLPIWDEDLRGIPNDFGRSSMFVVRNKREKRSVMQAAPLFHTDSGVRITYTGIELRADDDLKVWQQLTHYGRMVPLGEPVVFTMRQFLSDLKWPMNGGYYRAVRECIGRLKATAVNISHARLGRGVGVSLITRYEYDGENAAGGRAGLYRVWLDKDLMVLYAGDNYTLIPSLVNHDLSPVARRLYDYIGSHKKPYPLALDSFHKLCGSSCKDTYKWAQIVKRACLEVQNAGLVKSVFVAHGRIVTER